MPFDSLGRYVPNHKTWDHVGNVIPTVQHSEGQTPSIDAKPAAWLPVQFFDKYYENWLVLMPGKAVACDPNGDLMPAHYGLGGQSVVYTQNDVDNGVIDIATGLPVTVSKTVVLSQLNGVRGVTWSLATAGTAGAGNTSGFLGKFGIDAPGSDWDDNTVKYPIGVAPYPYIQWAGGDGFNPAELRQHNYNMQHRTAVLCDYVLRLPLVPAQQNSETVEKLVSVSPLVVGTRDTHTRAQVQANDRYNSLTGNVPVLNSYTVIALALDEVNLANQTSRTRIVMSSTDVTDDVSGVLVNEVSAVSAIKLAGDYYVDYAVGVVFLYSADGVTVPAAISGAAGTVSITYYTNSVSATVKSKFASVVGPIQCGDFLKVGSDSDLVPATMADDFKVILGQVVGFEKHPKDALDRVRTAFNPAIATDPAGAMANGTLSTLSNNPGQLDQMPGSANGGFPDLIHFSGAADTIILVNIVSR